MPPIQTVYLIHHSHTDVGYTHDQQVIWELYGRFLAEALLLAEKYASEESDAAFRWTVETTAPLMRWLEQASQSEVDRFVAMERAGRIEVTGMMLNVTPLYDSDQLIESLQNVGRLRAEYGFDIRYAMNCDVNGQNWPLVDLLLDAGIQGFTMAINNHFGGPLKPRPYPFLWQGPSGRSLPTYNGWTYDKGWHFGIGRADFSRLEEWWPLAQAYLDEIGYPLPILMLQSYHPFGDNGSAFDFTPFIAKWNAAEKTPRIVMATPRTWWQAVEPYRGQLATWRGDWTDFWNFGAISSAREQSLNRQSRSRLRTADALHAALGPLTAHTPADAVTGPQWAQRAYARYRRNAWEALNLWDEHTWGADSSIRQPAGEDTWSQWYQKAHYAYTARSLSLLLQRDGVAELARYVSRQDGEDGDPQLLLFNPLPWERTIAGAIRPAAIQVRGCAEDGTASRHHLDRRHTLRWHEEDLAQCPPEQRAVLPPTPVPGYGYVVVKRRELGVEVGVLETSEAEMVENHRFRLQVDREQGGVVSLYDKQLEWEWVDPERTGPFHGFVYEEVADREHPWPRHLLFERSWVEKRAELAQGWKPDWRARRRRPTELLSHQVMRTHLGWAVVQTLAAPGIEGVLTQRLFLPGYADWIECESWWQMGLSTHPSATYPLFPFHLPGATPRFDVGGQPVIADIEQLPGACRDYFTVQGWVDFSTAERGVTVATPDNPLVQLGNFHFGHYQGHLRPEKPTLLGWVTNNYWETNFRAHQPGTVFARYRIHPHAGGFDEAQAHRWGLEALYDEPLLQHLGEPSIRQPTLAGQGSLLHLPEPPVLVLHVKPADHGDSVLVRLFNASEAEQTARIGSGLLRIEKAQSCDLFGAPVGDLEVVAGSVAVSIPARRIAIVQMQLRPS